MRSGLVGLTERDGTELEFKGEFILATGGVWLGNGTYNDRGTGPGNGSIPKPGNRWHFRPMHAVDYIDIDDRDNPPV